MTVVFCKKFHLNFLSAFIQRGSLFVKIPFDNFFYYVLICLSREPKKFAWAGELFPQKIP